MPPVRSLEVGWLAVACVALLLILRGAPQFSNASVPPRGIADPVIGLQMARNVAEVDDILGQAPSPDREAMRIKQYIDFVFIAAYSALYVALARMLRSKLAIAAAVFGVAGAIFDVFENVAILRIVNVPLERTTQAMIDSIRDPSLAKWALAFVASAIFASIFLRRKNLGWRAAGLCQAVAAVLGFYGLFDNAFLVWAGVALFANFAVLAILFARLRLASARMSG